jgi:hypothetical protein
MGKFNPAPLFPPSAINQTATTLSLNRVEMFFATTYIDLNQTKFGRLCWKILFNVGRLIEVI